ncbi:MAG: hypothetical protein L0271_03500 [Gemmatimonadetes bacterium]|nr:hypothetical protein [Gemmatimonadota bacterium]
MSSMPLVIRLRRRPGALERLAGLMRRRRFTVERASIAFVDSGDVDVVLHVDASADRARLREELLVLQDVAAVESLDGTGRLTRELLLAWIRPAANARVEHEARIVALAGRDCLLEMTGSPDQVDDLLARLGDAGILTTHVRTEVPVPEPASVHNERGSE